MTVDYKPIIEESSYDTLTGQGKPVPIALYERIVTNGQYNLRERLRKTNMFWLGATTTGVTDPDNSEPDELVGYWNAGLTYTAGGSPNAGHDPQTFGLQFSTHIAEPYLLTIPVDAVTGIWNNQAAIESYKVRICARIEQADMQVIAFITNSRKTGRDDGSTIIFNGITNPADLINFASEADRANFKGDGFNTAIYDDTFLASIGAVRVTMTPTAGTGTDGCSYYEIEIPSIYTFNPDAVDPRPFNTNNTGSEVSAGRALISPQIVLMFLSKLGPLLDSDTLDASLPFPDADMAFQGEFVGSGAYIMTTAKYNAKYGNNSPPGKYHAMVKIEGLDQDTWHHSLQHIPLNPATTPNYTELFDVSGSTNPWSGNHHSVFVLYPSIPNMPTINDSPARVGANTPIEVYYVSKATLFSVTVEPSMGDVP